MTDDDALTSWRAAGLYDPAASDADERLALLRYTASRGASLEEMVEADASGRLDRFAADRAVRVERTLTKRELASASGLTTTEIDRAWRATGLPTVTEDDVPAFGGDDVELFGAFAVGAQAFGFDAMVQFSRVLGASLGRIADAAITSFLLNVESALDAKGAPPEEQARAATEASELLLAVPNVVGSLFRRLVAAAVERQRATIEPGSFDRYRMAIGFADLVGFTSWSQGLDSAELAAAVDDFEALAADATVAGGGRLVKMIGDAAMFVAPRPESAAAIALEIVAGVEAHPTLPPVRAAVAVGELLARDGDYFGPVVNLAGRAVKLADPGGVVVTADVAASLDGVSVKRTVGVRGVDDPVDLFAIGPPEGVGGHAGGLP